MHESLLQELDIEAGFVVPDLLTNLEHSNKYSQQMQQHFNKIKEYKETDSNNWVYLLSLGTLSRSLHQMDLNEAAYIIELRTGSAGHFSYREIAYQMYEELALHYPDFSQYIRVTNPREVFNPFQR